jgi:hypothetical protein
MNALYLLFVRQLAYFFKAGITEWEANTDYYVGSFCQINGDIYKSKMGNNVQSNKGNNPENSTDNWLKVLDIQNLFPASVVSETNNLTDTTLVPIWYSEDNRKRHLKLW